MLLRISKTLLNKVLTLVPITEIGPELFFANMTKFLSDSYDALEDTLTHMKSLKLKSYTGETITYFCTEICNGLPCITL